jgi:hypothetical protein
MLFPETDLNPLVVGVVVEMLERGGQSDWVGALSVHVAAEHVHPDIMCQDGALHARICEMEECRTCTWR